MLGLLLGLGSPGRDAVLPGVLRRAVRPFDVGVVHLPGVTAFGLLSALLAALVPALLASRQDVVAVLGGRRGDARPSRRSPCSAGAGRGRRGWGGVRRRAGAGRALHRGVGHRPGARHGPGGAGRGRRGGGAGPTAAAVATVRRPRRGPPPHPHRACGRRGGRHRGGRRRARHRDQQRRGGEPRLLRAAAPAGTGYVSHEAVGPPTSASTAPCSPASCREPGCGTWSATVGERGRRVAGRPGAGARPSRAHRLVPRPGRRRARLGVALPPTLQGLTASTAQVARAERTLAEGGAVLLSDTGADLDEARLVARVQGGTAVGRCAPR